MLTTDAVQSDDKLGSDFTAYVFWDKENFSISS